MLSKNKKDWEKVYFSASSLKKLPWIRTNVPFWFKNFFQNQVNFSCSSKILDVGCGNGYYAYYLSTLNFQVTGIDVSKQIIDVAKKTYKHKNLKFKEEDIFLKNISKEKYDFIYDIGLFHNILPKKRKEYSKIISKLLKKKGKFLLFCFDKREETFKNETIYLNTLYDMYSYPLSKEEIINTFNKEFTFEKIQELRYGTNNYKRRYLCLLCKK